MKNKRVKFPGTVTVKELIEELKKFDPSAICMLAINAEGTGIVEIDTNVSAAYRGSDGDVLYEDDFRKEETSADFDKVVIIWPIL